MVVWYRSFKFHNCAHRNPYHTVNSKIYEYLQLMRLQVAIRVLHFTVAHHSDGGAHFSAKFLIRPRNVKPLLAILACSYDMSCHNRVPFGPHQSMGLRCALRVLIYSFISCLQSISLFDFDFISTWTSMGFPCCQEILLRYCNIAVYRLSHCILRFSALILPSKPSSTQRRWPHYQSNPGVIVF